MTCAQKDDRVLVEATATKHSGYAYTVPVRLSSVLPIPSLGIVLDNLVQQLNRERFVAYETVHQFLMAVGVDHGNCACG